MGSDTDSDCTDESKSIIQRVKDCMGGEKSGTDRRD